MFLFTSFKKKTGNVFGNLTPGQNERQLPQMPYILHLLDIGTYVNKNVYFISLYKGGILCS